MKKSDREVLDRAFNEVKKRIIRLSIERDKYSNWRAFSALTNKEAEG